jgi:cytochrome P450
VQRIDTPAIDLLAPRSFAAGQPHQQFAWLRDHAPVYRHAEPDGPGFWALTRHDTVKVVGRDPVTFSSEPTIMIADPRAEGAALTGDHKMMLMADPPLHTRMRRLVNREFTPKAAARLRGRIEHLATQIVDAVAARGSCDLVSDLAGEMPSFVIADLLGIPLEDGRRLYHLTEALHSAPEALPPGAQQAAFAQMYGYSQQVWAGKRANPGDDLSSILIGSDLDGQPLDEIDFFLWFLLLIDAGGDTTRNLVGGGMLALFEQPDQLAWLQEDPDTRLRGAIEELLRWVSPVIYMRRTVTTDTELEGVRIPAGDKVVMYYGSANRDPRAFADADRLDLARDPNPHVAFGGGGPHFCLGAHLARVEIEALLAEVFRRLPDLHQAGPAEWLPSNFISGPRSLPVRFTPT